MPHSSGAPLGAVCQGRDMGGTRSPLGAGPGLPTCHGLLDSAVGWPWFLSHRLGQAPSFSPTSVSGRMAARGTELDSDSPLTVEQAGWVTAVLHYLFIYLFSMGWSRREPAPPLCTLLAPETPASLVCLVGESPNLRRAAGPKAVLAGVERRPSHP